jgi:malate dehydrogenase (oxaloacetate-decarboxylating)
MDYKQKALDLHTQLKGKISVISKQKVTPENLSLLYTPGVAEPCKEIEQNPELSYKYTARGNMIAVVSDGSAVLGLGNLGGLAGMPVMEGKCILFKEFAGVDAFPLCLNTQNPDEIVNIVQALEPSFGGINLEDISAPRCFEVEERLKKIMQIPVFHDDQHGTAVVVLAGLINALKIAKKTKENIKVVVNGPGAAGTAITKFLLSYGIKNIVVCGKNGILIKNSDTYNPYKRDLANITNPENLVGDLKFALKNADVFVGVSVADILTEDMINEMAKNPIVFALANPNPEVNPTIAKKCDVKLLSTGRSDYPNQINNVLAFPGIMRGALAVRASQITENMKISASMAIAGYIKDADLSYENFIPKAYNLEIGPLVAKKVAESAIKDGVAKIIRNIDEIEQETKQILLRQ